MPRANSQAVSINSSMSSTSTTPSCANTALLTSAEPVIDAVCDCAALRPYSERPTFSTTTGLPLRAACCTAATNLRPSLTPSSSVAMTLISGASAM